jgi:hypothetical protein
MADRPPPMGATSLSLATARAAATASSIPVLTKGLSLVDLRRRMMAEHDQWGSWVRGAAG